MRALIIRAHGGLEQLAVEDIAAPSLGAPGDVRVRVEAAALNHVDLFVLGGMPGVTIDPPWTLGADAVGFVEETGGSAGEIRVGDRVVVNAGLSCRSCEFCLAGEHPLCVRFALLGEHRPGTFAEEVVLPATNVRKVPLDVPAEMAAGFTLATLTAWRMVVTRAQVKATEKVLIWGIGGGVALAALQIAKARGASVWVTSGSDEKLAWARELGADVGINHRTTDVAREVRRLTGKRGVDVVIDSVGEATWAASLGSLARRGRLVTCGGTSGPMVQTDVRRLFWNQWTLMGSTMGNDRELDAILTELRDGCLIPPVDSVYPLERGAEAFARMQSGAQFGKIVLSVSA